MRSIRSTAKIARLGAALCSLWLAGCATTSVVWTKTDGGEADAVADFAECRMLAADETWRMSWERSWPPRFYDRRFMPPFYGWPMPFWYDFPMSIEREHALIDFCMHSKGYRLEALPH
jgi:hypothetical protein